MVPVGVAAEGCHVEPDDGVLLNIPGEMENHVVAGVGVRLVAVVVLHGQLGVVAAAEDSLYGVFAVERGLEVMVVAQREVFPAVVFHSAEGYANVVADIVELPVIIGLQAEEEDVSPADAEGVGGVEMELVEWLAVAVTVGANEARHDDGVIIASQSPGKGMSPT